MVAAVETVACSRPHLMPLQCISLVFRNWQIGALMLDVWLGDHL